MSFFKQFPKTLIDINEDGAFQRITDIFKYVDVADEKDDLYAYQFVDILNGERPDVLSQRLYGTPDYYWTFFITNDVLKGGGMEKWPQSALQYEEWLARVYGDYGVISFPRGFAGFSGIDFDDSDRTDKLYLVAENTADETYGLIRIVDYDADRMQLWVDKTKQYSFVKPVINRSLSADQLALWYPLAVSTDVDSDTNSIIDAATDSDYGGDLVGNTTGALGSDATHPLWDATVEAWYFDGVDAYIDVNPQDSQLFTDSDIDLPTMLRDNQDWTIAFWYKGDMGSGASSDSEAENGVLVGSTNQSGEPSSCIAIIDGKLSVVVVNSDSDSDSAATTDDATIYQHAVINDNKWHHCLVTNNGSTQEIDIYVDGTGNVVNKDAELDIYGPADSDYYGVFLVEHLMRGDITDIDSDTLTSDEPIELDTYTRGYMKDFRIYLRQLTSAERQAHGATDIGTATGTVSLDFDVTTASTAQQDLFFGWDRATYNSQPTRYSTTAITGNDSDDLAWNTEVYAQHDTSRTLHSYSVFIQRLAAYDYWEDATTAPSTYIPVHDETLVEFDDSDNFDEYEVAGTAHANDWYRLTFTNTEPGWIYSAAHTPWPTNTKFIDPAQNTDKATYQVGPWDEDSDGWLLDGYVIPSVVGDGTTKYVYVRMYQMDDYTWDAKISRIPAITTEPGVEVPVRSEVSDGTNYSISFSSEIGKRYVLFTCNTVGGTYVDRTTARHILGDGNDKTFVAFKDYRGMAGWQASSTTTDYFKIYSYISTPEYSNDPTKTATALSALQSNQLASTLPVAQMQKNGSAHYRSPNYVSYKEGHDIEQEERRRIKVVKPESIEGFAEEYTRLLNL
jgi:hypothetical protein